MHTSEWPREFSENQYVVVDGYTVKVFSSRGQSYNLISDASIVDAIWVGRSSHCYLPQWSAGPLLWPVW